MFPPAPVCADAFTPVVSPTQVHAHEIFMNGAFNGDPHPGNILLCDDGKIGLIDYGQVTASHECVCVRVFPLIAEVCVRPDYTSLHRSCVW